MHVMLKKLLRIALRFFYFSIYVEVKLRNILSPTTHERPYKFARMNWKCQMQHDPGVWQLDVAA